MAHFVQVKNDDYARIGLSELDSWKGFTECARGDPPCVECERASEADRKHMRRSLKVIRARLVIGHAALKRCNTHSGRLNPFVFANTVP